MSDNGAPQPPAEEHPDSKFRPADLTAFQQRGLLWAVNHHVLWPLGLALTMRMQEDGEITGPITINEWQAPDGHIETIEDDPEQPDFDRYLAFLDFVVDRLQLMPTPESDAAVERLGPLRIQERPKWRWVREP